MLTEEERTQIQAALAFYLAAAETSNVHPSQHPRVRPYFQHTRPLPSAAIDRLICKVHLDERDVRTLAWAVKKYSVKRDRLYYRLRKMGAPKVGSTGWHMQHLAIAAKMTRDWDEAFTRRFKFRDELPG